MFPRSERLSRGSFPEALAGKRLSTDHFSLVISQTPGYAVVVSKKVARLSTARHLLRRRVVAALRTLALPPGLIVFPKSSAVSLAYRAIRAELAEALRPRSR